MFTARFSQSLALPFPEDTFDAAVMPLVIFFVPDPARGVAEMARVVCPGGAVTAHAWDMEGGGFPYQTLHDEMREQGVAVPVPPSPGASPDRRAAGLVGRRGSGRGRGASLN